MSRKPLPRGALHLTMRGLYIAGIATFTVGTVVWILADAGLDAGPALYTLSVVILSLAWLALVLAACVSTYRRRLAESGHPDADPISTRRTDH